MTDIFVTRLEATGSGLVYSTYLGGSAGECSGGIAVDGVGNAYVTGITGSTDFPTTAGAIQSTHAGRSDAFLTKLAATGSELVYSTYLGASDDDSGFGIAVDGAGSAYVVGTRSSRRISRRLPARSRRSRRRGRRVCRQNRDAPTSKDECKHDGWNTFGAFKNQGDCVSFVASKGGIPPSRP